MATENTHQKESGNSEDSVRSFVNVQPVAIQFKEYAEAGNLTDAMIALKRVYEAVTSEPVIKEHAEIFFMTGFLPQEDRELALAALARYKANEDDLIGLYHRKSIMTQDANEIREIAVNFHKGLTAIVKAGQRIDKIAQEGGLDQFLYQ